MPDKAGANVKAARVSPARLQGRVKALDERIFLAQRRQILAEPGSFAHERAKATYKKLVHRQRDIKLRLDELNPNPNRGSFDPRSGAYFTGD